MTTETVNRVDAATRWRKKLSDANVFDRLLKHFNNELRVPLTGSQVMLGIKLMGKVLPDLQSSTLDIQVNHQSMNRLELEARMMQMGIDVDKEWQTIDNMKVIDVKPVLVEQDDEPVDNLCVDE